MEFRKIDKSNYWDCMELTVDDSQVNFVADNKQSLVEAAYEDGLYVLGIYQDETMVGFVLYDYDDTFPGWAMSRFMIGKQFQGKGYGKRAVKLTSFISTRRNNNGSALGVISTVRKRYCSCVRNCDCTRAFRNVRESYKSVLTFSRGCSKGLRPGGYCYSCSCKGISRSKL